MKKPFRISPNGGGRAYIAMADIEERDHSEIWPSEIYWLAFPREKMNNVPTDIDMLTMLSDSPGFDFLKFNT